MARGIFDRANQPKQLVLVPSAGYNDLTSVGGSELTQTLRNFVQGVKLRYPLSK